MPFPFELSLDEIATRLDECVDAVFGALRSEFLTMPRGEGFIEYSVFEQGYEALKKATAGFRTVSGEVVFSAVCETPIAAIVLRAMLGLSPPEWAYLATQRGKAEVSQNAARSLDRRIRMAPLVPLRGNGNLTTARLRALVETACNLLNEGAPPEMAGILHRLDKADTKSGLASLQPLAALGMPYAMVLYERFLGRPFAGHRDSVSELVGDVLETAIETVLSAAGISNRKTKRAERVAGFDQAPDFIVPDEFNPQIVIEAKITEDDGTARDKITRVQHLCALAMLGRTPSEPPRFEIVACIAGRGFKVRREDMKKLVLATRGKVFTLQNVPELVANTKLNEFRTR